MRSNVSYWLKAIPKDVAKRKWLKKEEDLKRLATTDDYRKFDKSVPFKKAAKILSDLMASSCPFSIAEFSCFIDYFVTSIIIDNVPRSGPVAYLTIDNVESGRKDGEMMLLKVHDHKTLPTSGPAILCIPLIMLNYLNIFITKGHVSIIQNTNFPLYIAHFQSSNLAWLCI